MKRLRIFLAMLVCAGLLCGCFGPVVPEIPDSTTPSAEATVPTTEETTIPIETTEITEPATTEPTEPQHSELYIPGVSVEDVIRYFNEVCLDAEFVNSGDASLLQKWDAPIVCTLYGDYTEEDYATLMAFFGWLNTVEGFPGISVAEEEWEANLRIHFCSGPDMVEILGENFFYMDGGVTFWYDGDNRIYDATICYRTELDQYLRNSVILEEIYNGLGPVQDTTLRPDSIIYAEFSQPQELTEIDELILRLLYHPDIKCGMNADECAEVIRQLYY